MRTLVLFLFFGCFVQLRKPEVEMFRLVGEIALAPVQQVVDTPRPMFIQIAEGLGNRTIVHMDCKSICAKLGLLGLAE